MTERLKAQISDRDRLVANLENSAAIVEERIQKAGREVDGFDHIDGGTSRKKERTENMESMLEGLKRIAKEVVSHCDQLENDQDEARVDSPKATRRSTSRSPLCDHSGSRSLSRRRSRSPSFYDSSFAAIQSAFHTCHVQISELRSKLASAQDQTASVKKHLDSSYGERRQLDNSVKTLKEEKDFL